MQKQIFITRKIPEIAEKMLRDKGYSVDVNGKDKNLSKRKLASLLRRKPYDAVLSLLTDTIDKDIFDAAPSVKIYSNYATGFDNIDTEEAKKRSITVANSPAPTTPEAVAEHSLALIFDLCKRVTESDRFIRAGKYKGWVPLIFLGTDVRGKTLGLVGAGRIGEKMAALASGIGMKVFYTDVVRNAALEETGVTYVASLKELLPQADFVSLHVPLTPSTRHLIDEEALKLMKPTAFLINTSRGPIVDEAALTKALKENTIGGAGLDVFEFEPKVTPALKKLPNVVLTPHIASASRAVRGQMAEIAAQNIIDFLGGKKPDCAVN